MNSLYGHKRTRAYPESAIPERVNLAAGNSIKSYEVKSILGEGSFGNVYKVSKNGQIYALKILRLFDVRPDLRNEIVKRFEREYECGYIDSLYVVKSYEKGIYNGNPYYVMEYCDQGSARELVGNISLIEFRKLLSDVLQGLKDLHNEGVIHRDIKPDNILKDYNGCYKLCDFGISAYSKSRITQSGLLVKKQIFGTYPYLAPEMVDGSNGKPMLQASDIFSLGVSLFELLTGRLPFGDLHDLTQLSSYLKNAKNHQYDSKLLKDRCHDLVIQEIIHRALAPKLSHRFTDVSQIIDLLGSGIELDCKLYDFQSDVVGLKIMYGDEPGRIYNLTKLIPVNYGELTIGWCNPESFGKNDIEIVEKYTAFISRKHATITKDDRGNAWIIKDGQRLANGIWKKSLNGTFVNGKKVPPGGVKLNLEDIVTIGETTLKLLKKQQ
jgi:serine/threonine protein kinase